VLFAEDVMQESLFKRTRPNWTPLKASNFLGWLKRIVVNNSIHQYRKPIKNAGIDLGNVTVQGRRQ